jgi:hypothetical protein
MTAAEQLVRRAHEYEVLAASHSERSPLGATGEHADAATAFTVVALVLREVAGVLEDDE